MRLGWIGLGKLGLPCALVLAEHHHVWGYDVSDLPWKILDGSAPPMREEGIGAMLSASRLRRSDSIADIVAQCDVIFIAVQTPHAPGYGGEKPMPEEARDFEYAYLAQACRDVAAAALARMQHVTLVVVSTVLPGTTDRVIRPLLNDYVSLVYSPQFIAMGTTIADFTNPEFVICGADAIENQARERLRAVFSPVHGDDRLFHCDIVTAESIKVYYNTYISMKIAWANHVMELCHKTGADCDKVVDALSLATDRVISPKYLRGGMGDGGHCHPRDLIALSWLEDRLDMSSPFFWTLSQTREWQAQWLASIVRQYAELTGYRVQILGRSYKPGSDLTGGSPALLLAHYLAGLAPGHHDPHVSEGGSQHIPRKLVYVIATRHPEFPGWDFHPGSVVIDPFGYVPDREGITVIRVGRSGSLRA